MSIGDLSRTLAMSTFIQDKSIVMPSSEALSEGGNLDVMQEETQFPEWTADKAKCGENFIVASFDPFGSEFPGDTDRTNNFRIFPYKRDCEGIEEDLCHAMPVYSEMGTHKP